MSYIDDSILAEPSEPKSAACYFCQACGEYDPEPLTKLGKFLCFHCKGSGRCCCEDCLEEEKYCGEE